MSTKPFVEKNPSAVFHLHIPYAHGTLNTSDAELARYAMKGRQTTKTFEEYVDGLKSEKKESTVELYLNTLKNHLFNEMPYEKLVTMDEDTFNGFLEEYLKKKEKTLSPKRLGSIYCAIVSVYRYSNKKARIVTPTLDFNSTLQQSAQTAPSAEKLLEICHGDRVATRTKCAIMLIAHGLRPYTILQIKPEWFDKSDIDFENKKVLSDIVRLNIPKYADIKTRERVRGNKLDAPFWTLIPKFVAEWILQCELPLFPSRQYMHECVTKALRKAGYKCSMYAIRNTCAWLLDRLSDEKFGNAIASLMMGHKGDMRAHYLRYNASPDSIAYVKQLYRTRVLPILQPSAKTDTVAMLVQQAKAMGVLDDLINTLKENLESGKMTIDVFAERLQHFALKAQKEQMDSRIDEKISERFPKMLDALPIEYLLKLIEAKTNGNGDTKQ